jgi:hypothetical protein
VITSFNVAGPGRFGPAPWQRPLRCRDRPIGTGRWCTAAGTLAGSAVHLKVAMRRPSTSSRRTSNPRAAVRPAPFGARWRPQLPARGSFIGTETGVHDRSFPRRGDGGSRPAGRFVPVTADADRRAGSLLSAHHHDVTGTGHSVAAATHGPPRRACLRQAAASRVGLGVVRSSRSASAFIGRAKRNPWA